jgi:anti-sigma B factor antagonist
MSPQDRLARSLRWTATARRRRASSGMAVHPAGAGLLAGHPGGDRGHDIAVVKPTTMLPPPPGASAAGRPGDVEGSSRPRWDQENERGERSKESPVRVGDDFEISSCVNGMTATVAVRGELDIATAARLVDEVTLLTCNSPRHVTVDLEETTFVDLSGLRGLVEAQRKARASGGDIVVHAPPRSLRKVLALAGADAVLVLK